MAEKDHDMSTSAVLLTGTEIRHEFFRKYVASSDGVKVLSSYCESQKGDLTEVVSKDNNPKELRSAHLSAREATEKDFFQVFNARIPDESNPKFIVKGEINESEHVEAIIKLNPDIIVSFGCSIIRSKLLSIFKGRFVNIHLGLSPYYRGAGTNFWPIVNKELEFIGTTFMYIDEGVDTGEIIHQIRAEINIQDNIHQIGNRLIRNSFIEVVRLIRNFQKLERVEQISMGNYKERVYRKKDFTEDSLERAYENISNGIVAEFLANKSEALEKYPIITNPGLK